MFFQINANAQEYLEQLPVTVVETQINHSQNLYFEIKDILVSWMYTPSDVCGWSERFF